MSAEARCGAHHPAILSKRRFKLSTNRKAGVRPHTTKENQTLEVPARAWYDAGGGVRAWRAQGTAT